jgi:hypothetical protein
MSLSDTRARAAVRTLHAAAFAAIEAIRADEARAWSSFQDIPQQMPNDINVRDLSYCEFNLCRTLQSAAFSILGCRSLLEGLIWLANLDYRRGIRLLEFGVATEETAGRPPQCDSSRGIACEALRVLREQDFAALTDMRKVAPGLFDRIYDAKFKASPALGYMSAMLAAYAAVACDVAATLERGVCPTRHEDMSGHGRTVWHANV